MAESAETFHLKVCLSPNADPFVLSSRRVRRCRDETLRFTLPQDITAAIPPGEETFFFRALEHASRFEPLTGQEQQRLLAEASGIEPLFRYE
jgi:hypothetical protein